MGYFTLAGYQFRKRTTLNSNLHRLEVITTHKKRFWNQTQKTKMELESLRLSNANRISYISSISYINIYINRISYINKIAYISSISYINIYINRISYINKIAYISSISYINIYINRISYINKIAYISSKEKEDLLYGHLSSI